MAQHGLALAVINTGSHYKARCKNYREMTPRHYRTYILGLVTAEARKQRIEFGVQQQRRCANCGKVQVRLALTRSV